MGKDEGGGLEEGGERGRDESTREVKGMSGEKGKRDEWREGGGGGGGGIKEKNVEDEDGGRRRGTTSKQWSSCLI